MLSKMSLKVNHLSSVVLLFTQKPISNVEKEQS